MFISALFTIGKTWNQPKCPSRIDWIRKMWHTYTMEYYAAIKKSEFVSFACTWMNLETIILSKLTQEQKTKYCCSNLVEAKWWEHMDTKRETTDTGAYLRMEGRRRVRIKKWPIEYYAYYLGDEISCTPNPHNTQLTYMTNLQMYPWT